MGTRFELSVAFAAMIGCSSATTTTTTGQAPSEDPTVSAEPPSTPPSGPSLPPSESAGGMPQGCPSTRALQTAAKMPSVEELRTMLVGTYRHCYDGNGLELRLDPDDATHILWYRLDGRFVRTPGPQEYGWLTIDECITYECTTMWHVGENDQMNGYRALRLWLHPLAIVVQSDATGAEDEWVHVAK